MIKKECSGLSFLAFEQLDRYQSFRHGISLRRQNIRGQDDQNQSIDFDLSSHANPRLLKNRKWFCRAVGLPVEQLVRPQQVHGNEVKVVEQGTRPVEQTDGLCTRTPGVGLLLLGADCPLVVVFDPGTVALGVAHAGWRGTVGRITEKLIATMAQALGCNPAEMIAGIGPGISCPYYEIGADVAQQVSRQLPNLPGILHQNNDRQRWRLDLIEANRLQLVQAGLSPDHIELSGCCTYRDKEMFFSYRRQGQKAGRWGLLAGLAEMDE